MTAAAHRVETDAGKVQRDQGTGKVFRLVGEHGQPEPGILQAAKGRDKAGIGRGADAEVGGIVAAPFFGQGIQTFLRSLGHHGFGQGPAHEDGEAVADHPPVGADRMDRVAVGGKDGIAGAADVGKGVQQGSVQIKKTGFHVTSERWAGQGGRQGRTQYSRKIIRRQMSCRFHKSWIACKFWTWIRAVCYSGVRWRISLPSNLGGYVCPDTF